MRLLDNVPSFGQNADGVFVKHEQPITDDFLDSLHSERMAKEHVRHGELNRVASVPTSVVELWLRQGIDVWNMTPHEVVARLERDNLHAFITTPGRV
jgi:hypothetical protein